MSLYCIWSQWNAAGIETKWLKKCLLLITIAAGKEQIYMEDIFIACRFIMLHQVKTHCKGKDKTELARSLLVLRKNREREPLREREV